MSFLQQCLTSVTQQVPAPGFMEVLVCDDHSSTDVRELIHSWGFEGVRFVSRSCHYGQWKNVNVGLTETAGEWVHILHDDDYVLPGFYRAMQDAIELAPRSVGVVTCLSKVVDSAGLGAAQPPFQSSGGLLEGWLERITIRNPVNLPSVVVRRAVYQTVGNYCEEISSCADWDFHIRSASRFDWWYVPEALACYRRHGESVTAELARSGRLARDIRKTIERAEQSMEIEATKRGLPLARLFHSRNFSAEAAEALHRGNVKLGVALLREALALASALEAQ